ncbi:MAG: hypothetical protein LBI02_00035 [Opitutaceae bacterium]|nr:hypothetical protein [Opitutaceae bacterium]
MIYIIAISVVVLFAGCAKKQGLSGTCMLQGSTSTLTLTDDGQFLFNNGDAGSYTVEGGMVIMMNPIFGGAKGEIKGSALVFPEAQKGDFVGSSFSGTWFPKNSSTKGH